MVLFLVWGVWDWILQMMSLFQPLRLPNTFLGGGCPNTFQRPWLMEVCLGVQTPMYSQGVWKTSHMFFCWGLIMFNERRQLDTTKPPWRWWFRECHEKGAQKQAGPILLVVVSHSFWGKRCGWSRKRKYYYAKLLTILGYRHLFASIIELIYPSFNKKEPRWTIPWPLVLGISQNG